MSRCVRRFFCRILAPGELASGELVSLGEFTGDSTPPLISSTGRDMFVQFTTDHGNYGITSAGSHEDPGFYVSERAPAC